MTLRSQVIRGGAILVARQGLGTAFNVVGTLVLTRILGPESYGLYAAAFVVVSAIVIPRMHADGNVNQAAYNLVSGSALPGLKTKGPIQREPYGDVWDTMLAPDLSTLLGNLDKVERVLPPGRRFHYSNLGFSLLGHLFHMARASGVAIDLDSSAIPILPDAEPLAGAGNVTKGGR